MAAWAYTHGDPETKKDVHGKPGAKEKIMAKDKWVFERSSGYAGWRCTECGTWTREIEVEKRICECEETENKVTICDSFYEKSFCGLINIGAATVLACREYRKENKAMICDTCRRKKEDCMITLSRGSDAEQCTGYEAFDAESIITEDVDRGRPAEKDPNGIDQHEPGAKLDAGKPLAGILGDFSLALMEVIKVGTYGAEKYSRGGWQSVENGEERYTDAMLRHYLGEHTGITDTETGLRHDAQLAWNALARLELRLREKQSPKRKDYEYPKGEPARFTPPD